MSIEHILEYIGWLRSYGINNCTTFAKAQMSEHRASTICMVVLLPDRHCDVALDTAPTRVNKLHSFR